MQTAATSSIGRTRAALAPGITVLAPGITVLAVVVVAATIGLRGADYPAQLLRAVLWDQTAASVWNFHWYAGHPTPSYSVLTPALSTLVGPFGVAAIGAVAATWCFSSLTRALVPSSTTALAGHAFAVAVAVNVIVGRAAFSLGLALALGTLLAWHRRRFTAALLLAVLVPLASPVAAVFLAVAAASVAIVAVRRRPPGEARARCSTLLRQGSVLTVATLVPVAVTTSVLRDAGRFPFRGAPFVVSLVVLAALVVVARAPQVRTGAALSALVSVAVFVVPNPLGGNVLRLSQMIAVPLAIAVLPESRRLGRSAFAALAAVAVFGALWSVQPAVEATRVWAGDASIRPDYHRPLIEQVRARNADGSPIGRLEIPFSENHWESLFVAAEVPYARGWERQVDLVRNAVLYEPDLTLDEYHRWLFDNAVRWIAVPDVALDESGRNEARLIAREDTSADVPWLRAVWQGEHWRLYEVLDARPIVDPPASLVSQGADVLIVRTDRPATVTVRYRFTPHLVATGGACLRERPDGWITADLPAAGEYVFGVDPMASLLGGGTPRCD